MVAIPPVRYSLNAFRIFLLVQLKWVGRLECVDRNVQGEVMPTNKRYKHRIYE